VLRQRAVRMFAAVRNTRDRPILGRNASDIGCLSLAVTAVAQLYNSLTGVPFFSRPVASSLLLILRVMVTHGPQYTPWYNHLFLRRWTALVFQMGELLVERSSQDQSRG